MAKTHYGYKDGQFKQGKCEVTTGTCPYGNHSEDPNKINDLREYVYKTLNENPNYRIAYQMVEGIYGAKNVEAKHLMARGIPEKLAKAWANEPVSAEYERDYVADGTAEAPAETEQIKEETNAKAPVIDDSIVGAEIPVEGDATPKIGYRGWKDRTGWVRISKFQDAAKKLEHPETLTEEERERLEAPYDELEYVNRMLAENYQLNNPGEPLPEYLTGDAIEDMKRFGEPGNEINDKIIAGLIVDGQEGIPFESREFARQNIDADFLLNSKDTHFEPKAFTDVDPGNVTDVGKDLDTEQKRHTLSTYVGAVAQLHKDALDAKSIRYINDEPDISAKEMAERAVEYRESYGAARFMVKDRHFEKQDIEAEEYDRGVSRHWRENMKPGAYIMLGKMDAEVYTLQEDGRITSPDGVPVGWANYETGELYDRVGTPLYHTGGAPRLFKDDEAVLKYAVADGQHKVYHVANNSTDPGFYSRYEISDDPVVKEKLGMIRGFYADKDEAYERVAERKESISNAITDEKPAEVYSTLRKLGLPKLEALEPGSKPRPTEKLDAENQVKAFIKDGITNGDLEYMGNGSFAPGSGLSIEDMKNTHTLDYDRIFDENDSVATRASMVATVRRNRNFGSSFDSFISDVSSPKPGRYSPVAHRRRHWNPNEPRAFATEGKTGELITSNHENPDGTYDTYIMVNAKRGMMLPIEDGLIPVEKNEGGVLNAPVSEETVQTLLDRYHAGDRELSKRIKVTDDIDWSTNPLYVW